VSIIATVTPGIAAKITFKSGSEAWTLKKRDVTRLEAAEMILLLLLTGITRLDY
jgi:hypothetical protein